MQNATRLRSYETMFIIKQSLSKEEIEAKIQFVKDTITKNGGELVSEFDMGTRTLAYQIEKEKTGHYYVIYFTIDSAKIKELNRVNNIDENIIRFIFIKYESKTELAHWSERSEMAKKGQIDVKAPKVAPREERSFDRNNRSNYNKEGGGYKGREGGSSYNRAKREGDNNSYNKENKDSNQSKTYPNTSDEIAKTPPKDS
jgi:small subunit ribosomal protein S6